MTGENSPVLEVFKMEMDRLWASITVIQQDMAVMKATSGRVRLTTGVGALLWGILIGVVGLAVFAARLDEQVRLNARLMERYMGILESHVSAPSHANSGARLDALEGRLERLEKRGR